MKSPKLFRQLAYIVSLVSVSFFVAEGREGISVSPSPTNNYVIPPGQNSKSISFDVTVTGPYSDMLYRYHYYVDGNLINTISLGNGSLLPNPKSSSFGASITYGYHTVSVTLQKMTIASPETWSTITSSSTSVTLDQLHTVTLQNSFGAGNVIVDDTTRSSGVSFTWQKYSSHSAVALDYQTYGDYVRRFVNNWSGFSPPPVTEAQVFFYVEGNATYTAEFKKEFNVIFQNSLPGASGGQIVVGGVMRTSPHVAHVIEDDNISAAGPYQVINQIEYTFSSWSSGSSPFTPTNHCTITANYSAKPLPPANVSAGGAVDDPVQITWTEHPNDSVTQYQIWRIIKPLGQSQGSPELVATVNRGTTSYIDYQCIITEGYTEDLVSYDVRSYFSINSSYSDPNYVSVFADSNPPVAAQDGEKTKVNALSGVPSSFAVSSFPNPFNPSTTISYQLVEDADVTLNIFDMMGREVISLVNDRKNTGYHFLAWQGKDNRGTSVASGTYVYRFTASPLSGNKPFIRSGKLLLTK